MADHSDARSVATLTRKIEELIEKVDGIRKSVTLIETRINTIGTAAKGGAKSATVPSIHNVKIAGYITKQDGEKIKNNHSTPKKIYHIIVSTKQKAYINAFEKYLEAMAGNIWGNIQGPVKATLEGSPWDDMDAKKTEFWASIKDEPEMLANMNKMFTDMKGKPLYDLKTKKPATPIKFVDTRMFREGIMKHLPKDVKARYNRKPGDPDPDADAEEVADEGGSAAAGDDDAGSAAGGDDEEGGGAYA